MQAEVITEQLGDGYYHHQVNVSTYYYYESVTSPIALRDSRASKARRPTDSLGRFQPYRLSHLVSASDIGEEGRVVRLATVHEGRLVVDPDALKVFQKYSENEIAFVGNYGRSGSGKSYWYDKILNLSDFDGNNYSSNRREPGLYFWSIPYSKDNLKFFLVDYHGFQGKEQLSGDEQKLLDLELLLSEKLVVVPEPQDEELGVLRPAYSHLLQSQQRFSDRGIQANKFSPYWPNQIYTLYRSAKPVKKEIDNIGLLFATYNFSILHDAAAPAQPTPSNSDLLKATLREHPESLNEKYVKMTSVVFKDIHEKMNGKEHGNVVFNGKNLPHILEQSAIAINSGRTRQMDQIFQGVKGDIYAQTLNKCKQLYLSELQPIKRNGLPQPIDVLTEAFDRGNNKAWKEFDREVIDKQVHADYEKKLQAEIDNIEAEVLKENQQKTYEYYNKKLPNNEAADPDQYFTQLKNSFTEEKKAQHLDHSDTQPVQQRLQKLVSIDAQEIILVPAGAKHKEETLKRQVALKKKELESILAERSGLKGGKDQPSLPQKHEVLISRAAELKQELDDHKTLEQLTPAQKEMLLTTLREVHTNNESKLTEIKATPHKEDEISQLRDRLRKAAGKNSVIESSLLRGDKSYVDNTLPADRSGLADKSFASNRSGRSVIRDIKSQNIKKISTK